MAIQPARRWQRWYVRCWSHPRKSQLAFQFLLCPIMDFAAETESRRDFATGLPGGPSQLCSTTASYYLGADGDPADPRVSPLRRRSCSGLPPTIIHTAEFDPLRDEGAAYAQRLEAAGVRTTYRCHPGMIHLFYGMAGVFPYASAAFALIGSRYPRPRLDSLRTGAYE